jgi:hypothetical protein
MISTHSIIFEYLKDNNIEFEKNKLIINETLIAYIYAHENNGISIHIYDNDSLKLWEMLYDSYLNLIYSNTFLNIYQIFIKFPLYSDILAYKRKHKIDFLTCYEN